MQKVTSIPLQQRGIALVIVLWLTVLLTVIGGAFAFSMRNEALASRNAVSLARARAAADGAIERTTFELLRPRTLQSWKADGAQRLWRDGDLTLVVSARDESARIDINTGAELLLKSVFLNLAGLTDAEASAMVDAIVDWRDPDEARRPNGAEAPEYRAANSNYTPSNRAFETLGELSRVLNVTPAIYGRVAGVLTVHSRQSGVNAADRGARHAARSARARRPRRSTNTSSAATTRWRRTRRCRHFPPRRDSRPAPARSGASALRPPRPMV